MPTYVSDLKEDLAKKGPARFIQENPHPVLVVLGLTGTLQDSKGAGTVVAQASDTLLLTTIVGRVFPVIKGQHAKPGPVTVGRVADNDICVPEYSISKLHCYLVVSASEVRLMDCGSTNGTQVNGQTLQPKKAYPLAGGERLVLGRFAFLFHRAAGFAEYLKNAK
jgi:pSer/pThr/pTyr-binding forkhead associated (FHA) protein